MSTTCTRWTAPSLLRIPEGEAADRETAEKPSFTRYTLLDRGADYYRQVRTPRAQWRRLDDVAPQLAEFDLRCAAADFDTAAEVLLEIDFNYLLTWGHSALMAAMHERLRGRIDDADLQGESAGNPERRIAKWAASTKRSLATRRRCPPRARLKTAETNPRGSATWESATGTWARRHAPSTFTSRRSPLTGRLATGRARGKTSSTWESATRT